MAYLSKCVYPVAEGEDPHQAEGIKDDNSIAFYQDRGINDVPIKVDEQGIPLSHCDNQEVTDMKAFQLVVNSMPVESGDLSLVGHDLEPTFIAGDGLLVPDVVSTSIPVSVLFVAHHNLVTYGVPFLAMDGKWTNPGPEKTYYAPPEAIQNLAGSALFKDDEDVQEWVQTFQRQWSAVDKYPNEGVGTIPGMTPWALKAKEQFAAADSESDIWKEWHTLPVTNADEGK